MRSWVVEHCGPIDTGPLRRIERVDPAPGPGQVRVRVSCCGVCRTDLHLAEGDLPPRRPQVTPGHEVVGTVDLVGEGATRFQVGDRVGVAWLAGTDGSCRFCRRGAENLCVNPKFTGWDLDGGYADYCLVDEAFAYVLPEALPGEQAAPLLCAGIIGYRALRCAAVPPGGRLGIYGFGGSAHLTAQLALHEGLRVHVLTRGEANRDLATRLGVDSVGDAADAPPEPLDGAILFAPAGDLVPVALAALDRGATLAVAGYGSPTSRYCAMPTTSSRNGGCAASPQTPAPTARRSSLWRSGTAYEPPHMALRWPTRQPRSPGSSTVGSTALPSCTTELRGAPPKCRVRTQVGRCRT